MKKIFCAFQEEQTVGDNYVGKVRKGLGMIYQVLSVISDDLTRLYIF